jgi:hypothetical protein
MESQASSCYPHNPDDFNRALIPAVVALSNVQVDPAGPFVPPT